SPSSVASSRRSRTALTPETYLYSPQALNRRPNLRLSFWVTRCRSRPRGMPSRLARCGKRFSITRGSGNDRSLNPSQASSGNPDPAGVGLRDRAGAHPPRPAGPPPRLGGQGVGGGQPPPPPLDGAPDGVAELVEHVPDEPGGGRPGRRVGRPPRAAV